MSYFSVIPSGTIGQSIIPIETIGQSIIPIGTIGQSIIPIEMIGQSITPSEAIGLKRINFTSAAFAIHYKVMNLQKINPILLDRLKGNRS